MKDVADLVLIIDSHVPIIVLETRDETLSLELMTQVAMKKRLGFYCWSITEGLSRIGFGADTAGADTPLDDPAAALKAIKHHTDPCLYVLCDFHPYLNGNPEHVRLLKDIALNYSRLRHTIVLLSHELTIQPKYNPTVPDLQ